MTTIAVSAALLAPVSRVHAQAITGTLSGRFYFDSTQSTTTVGTPGSTTTTSAFYYIANHATPTGTFSASTINYTGTDTTLIKAFLGTGADSTSYVGDATKTLQDGILDIKGTITFSSAATYSFTTSSDDGSAVFINGTEVVNNDGTHGNTSVTGSYVVSAAAAKSQSFELVYFNHNYNNGTGGANLSFTSPTGVTYSGAALPEPGCLTLLTLSGLPLIVRITRRKNR